jgi:hypothetical protein
LLRFMTNFTAPVTSAKRVWSLPIPTPSPGQNLVPRWRTMIEPALIAFAAELLHAKTAAGRIAPVARGAAGFLVSHGLVLLVLERRSPV